jgi:1,4-dihydroxy-2-naphthoate octaprenyltransferase
VWLNAARLRTLPLSVSGILMGTALAAFYGHSDSYILLFALLTTIAFQVTSNLANDYGDGVKGTDNADRIGPSRALQSGLLSRKELKNGILLSALLSFFLASALVLYAFRQSTLWYVVLFTFLGIASIWASINYTVGDRAYGYRGLGDLFVFVFFGLLSVLGSMFLFTKFLTFSAFLPAISIGLLSTGVLNLNNLRDYETDKRSGKHTVVVSLGIAKGKRYHYLLLTAAFLSMLLFSLLHYQNWKSLICLVAFIPVFVHLRKVAFIREAVHFDPELKKLALSTFLLAVLSYMLFNYFL